MPDDTSNGCYPHFNPRSPHGERQYIVSCRWFPENFNPRSPHGERRENTVMLTLTKEISIHAPRTGSDQSRFCSWKFVNDFNPRSPHGERRFFVPYGARI